MLLALLAPSKVSSVDAQVEDVGILVANILNAIAVMHVGIKEENALGRSRVNGVFGCLFKTTVRKRVSIAESQTYHSTVIKVTKSHWLVLQSVMARWSGGTECVGGFA